MPASDRFSEFCQKIGLRQENIDALWNANIKSPHEIASCTTEQLQSICDNAFLINSVHPVLKKNVFGIATAADPVERALSILKDASRQNEPTDASAAPYTTDSDAVPDSSEYRTGFDNPAARTQNKGNAAQKTKPKAHTGEGMGIINIRGGNFVQSRIGGEGNTIFNNINTTINSSNTVGSGDSVDLEKLRASTLTEKFLLNGNYIMSSDIGWKSGEDFWLDGDFQIPNASASRCAELFRRQDVYPIKSPGKSRALIINNYDFRNPKERRNGAERDTANMEKLMTGLGFKIVKKTNLTAPAIMQTLREFVDDPTNKSADMFAVYIGSHGRRDTEGKDTFIGVDGAPVKFEEVKAMFYSSSGNPYLKDKPKIFFLQFCRLLDADQSAGHIPPATSLPPSSDTENDSEPIPEDQRPMDFLCAYATLAGSKAYRSTRDGSWFVTTVVKVLGEESKSQDLLSMLTQVNDVVSLKQGKEGDKDVLQISEVVYNLRKKVVFLPGLV